MRQWVDWESRINKFFNFRISFPSSYLLRTHFIRKRVLSLRIAIGSEIKSGHQGAVNWSTLDDIEGKYLLTGGVDSTVCLYSLDFGNSAENNKLSPRAYHPISKSTRALHTGHIYGISTIQWYPIDNGAFITSSFDETVKVWDTDTFSVAGSFNLHKKVYCAKMRSNGDLIAVGADDNKLRICDVLSGSNSYEIVAHRDSISSVDWCSQNSNYLASASFDGTTKVWDIRKTGNNAALLSLDWYQDHTYRGAGGGGNAALNAGGLRRDIILEDISTSHGAAVMGMRYSESGHNIITSGNDKRIRVWNSLTGALSTTHYSGGCRSLLPYKIETVSFTGRGDDVMLIPGNKPGDVDIFAIHSSTGLPLKRLTGAHVNKVTATSFHKQFQEVITSGLDGMIYLWSPSQNQPLDNEENEKDTPRVNTRLSPQSSRDTSSSTAPVLGNNDNWSSDEEEGSGSESAPATSRGGRRVRGRFVPPIVQQLIDAQTMNMQRNSNSSNNSINRNGNNSNSNKNYRNMESRYIHSPTTSNNRGVTVTGTTSSSSNNSAAALLVRPYVTSAGGTIPPPSLSSSTGITVTVTGSEEGEGEGEGEDREEPLTAAAPGQPPPIHHRTTTNSSRRKKRKSFRSALAARYLK